MTRCSVGAVALVVAAALTAACASAQASTITEEKVREVVTWLAADERKGRGTGTPEAEEAAQWLAARFAAAGLRQVVADTWRHEFPLRGFALDSKQIAVELVREVQDEETKEKKAEKIVLEPDRDVRQWTVGDETSGAGEACTVARLDDPVLQRLLFADSARRPVFCEVAEEHPYWRRAAGEHKVLGSRRSAARPVFLVREGVLPTRGSAGDANWKATWSVAASEAVDVPQANVLAMVEGGDKKDEYVVVSAHYDHLGQGQAIDGDDIYNGADDNATGTTAVVLIAEAMAKMPAPRRSVMFVCFTGEERRLLGSAAFCEKPPVPLERFAVNLNIEMIGRPANDGRHAAWITGAELSDFAAIAEPALQRAGITLRTHRLASRLFEASDNLSFARRGIVAHSISAGELHADYHRPSDHADKLDVPHMTKVVQGLLEVTLEFANRDQSPQWNDAGKQRIARWRR